MSGSTSPYAMLGQGVTPIDDPLAKLGQVQGIRALMNRNQAFADQQKIGQAFNNAVDPTTGLDPNKLASNIAGSGATVGVPEAMAAAQTSQRSATALSTEQFQLANARIGRLRQEYTSLLNNPNSTKQDAMQAGNQMAADGLVSPQELATEYANIPNDPTQFRAYVQRMALATQQAHQQINAIYGSGADAVSTGDQTQFVNRNAFGQVNRAGGNAASLQNRMGPGDATGLIEYVDSAGVRHQVTKAQWAALQGAAGTTPAAAGAIPSMRAGAGGAAAQAPGVAGPSPTLGADIEGYTNALKDVPQSQQREQSMRAALDAMQHVQTGPGTDKLQQVRSLLTTFVPPSMLPEGFNAQAADYDTARKYMLQAAAKMGMGSDQQLNTMISANPSVGINADAAKEILASQIGQERFNRAAVTAAPGYQGFQQQQGQFAQQYDKRAFAADLMSPDQIKTLTSRMKPEELTKFKQSLGFAAKHNLISVPGAGGGQ